MEVTPDTPAEGLRCNKLVLPGGARRHVGWGAEQLVFAWSPCVARHCIGIGSPERMYEIASSVPKDKHEPTVCLTAAAGVRRLHAAAATHRSHKAWR